MGNRNTETGQIESIEELLLDDEAIADLARTCSPLDYESSETPTAEKEVA